MSGCCKAVFIGSLSLLVLLGFGGVILGEGCFSCHDLLKLGSVVDPAISPDGRWIAYVTVSPPDTSMGERRTNSDIWIVRFDGGSPPRRFAFGPAEESSPRWSPDGRWIAFLSDREGDGKQVYRIRFGGGEAERITGFGAGVHSFSWSPDGGRFALIAPEQLPATVEEERSRGDDEIVVDGEDRFARVWIVDSTTGEGDAVTPESLHVQSLDWSPDGAAIACIVSDRPTSDEMYYRSRLEVIRLIDGDRALLSKNAGGIPRWSPDRRSIAFIYKLEHPEMTIQVPVVAVVDAAGGNLRLLGKRHQGSFRDPRWLPDCKKLVVIEMAGVRGRLVKLSIEDEDVDHLEDMNIPYYGTNSFDVSRDGSRIAWLKGGPQSPPELWSREKGLLGGERKLTGVNDWLEDRTLPTAEVVKWSSRDGTEIEGILYLPPGYSEERRYPAVVAVHGGPMWSWWLGWHGTWHEWAVPLACRGFVVLLPNPRGSLGYGIGFARANFDDFGGGDLEDILAGADFLVDRGYADQSRLGIGGWSYGGYMSSWAVTQTKRFAAAVVGAGVTNLFSFHGTTDITPTFLRSYLRDIAYRRPGAYRKHSAVDFVQNAGTPTLIIHGEEDERVPVGQAYELYRGLRQSGVTTELVVYPREGHAFREIYHQIDLLERIIGWYERHLEN